MSQIQCPNCKAYFVKLITKQEHLYKGIIADVIGLVLLGIGLGNRGGLILLSSPFIVYGALHTFIGAVRKTNDRTCKNCNYQFTTPA